jgi:hypothetical protein
MTCLSLCVFFIMLLLLVAKYMDFNGQTRFRIFDTALQFWWQTKPHQSTGQGQAVPQIGSPGRFLTCVCVVTVELVRKASDRKDKLEERLSSKEKCSDVKAKGKSLY